MAAGMGIARGGGVMGAGAAGGAGRGAGLMFREGKGNGGSIWEDLTADFVIEGGKG